jgi:uncharacterized protein (DUF427 family)
LPGGLSAIRSQFHIQAGTPDHPITIAPAEHGVRITFAGQVVAESKEALLLTEASYAPVYYVPPQHVDFAVLARTDHKTRCPYKGEAAYYSIRVGDRIARNAVWSYEHPLEAVAAIAGYLAFYPDLVDSVAELPL